MPEIGLGGVREASRMAMPTGVARGGRDSALHAWAGSLQARGVADDEIVALVLEANATFDPPLPEWQARKCAESALRYEKGARGASWGRAARTVAQTPPRVVRRVGHPEMLGDCSAMPPEWQAREWLRALFEPDEVVCLVFEPRSRFPETEFYAYAGQLCDEGDPLLGRLLGAVRPCGLWAVENPVREPGGGRTKADVASLRWALVECDGLPADQQLERICALLMDADPRGYHARTVAWSGNRSWHALVHVGASDAAEYRERVERLYRFCEANGLPVDRSCRNENRLTRVPGAWRGETGQMQTLLGRHA